VPNLEDTDTYVSYCVVLCVALHDQKYLFLLSIHDIKLLSVKKFLPKIILENDNLTVMS
jgi:hypothetical protein